MSNTNYQHHTIEIGPKTGKAIGEALVAMAMGPILVFGFFAVCLGVDHYQAWQEGTHSLQQNKTEQVRY